MLKHLFVPKYNNIFLKQFKFAFTIELTPVDYSILNSYGEYEKNSIQYTNIHYLCFWWRYRCRDTFWRFVSIKSSIFLKIKFTILLLLLYIHYKCLTWTYGRVGSKLWNNNNNSIEYSSIISCIIIILC